MSAEVEEITLYSAACSACGVGTDPNPDEDHALDWAANHDAEQHTDYTDADAADDAREHAREARMGY